ncbi:MAG: type II toxin-antitoxin system RelE/ParE family toxin [Clostridia bacterium]|nr:type II toxin-antitoxin system RelE/ParE family toxin [Clostridia bacterium]
MQLVISNQVRKDIAGIYKYIANDSIKYANETVNNIYSHIAELKTFPYIGRYAQEIPDKQYRELLYKNYRIIYTISEEKETVYIRFVIHGKRDFRKFSNKYIIKK